MSLCCPLRALLIASIQCDRASPCSNCVARKKESFCHYENESARKQQLLEESTRHEFKSEKRMGISHLETDPTTEVSALGYAKGDNGATTMGIYNRIERYGEEPSPIMRKPPSTSADNETKKYKALIRQLPAKEYIEKLIAADRKSVV